MPASEFETVATVESMSKPGKFYTIKLSRKDGQMSCNCPAWIFQKGGERKPCKHIKHLEKAEAEQPMRELVLTAQKPDTDGLKTWPDCPAECPTTCPSFGYCNSMEAEAEKNADDAEALYAEQMAGWSRS